VALDTTPGGASADSYASLAEADTYHTNHLYASVWDAASDPQKESGLIMAARLLDAMPRAWTGNAVNSTQALGWPRSGMLTRNGFEILQTVIPSPLKNAQSELARQLLAADLTETNAVAAQGIKSLKAGPVALAFKDGLDIDTSLLAMIPDAVIALLVPSWLIDVADITEDRDGLVVEVL